LDAFFSSVNNAVVYYNWLSTQDTIFISLDPCKKRTTLGRDCTVHGFKLWTL